MLGINRSTITYITMYIMNRYIELGSTNIEVADRMELIIQSVNIYSVSIRDFKNLCTDIKSMLANE